MWSINAVPPQNFCRWANFSIPSFRHCLVFVLHVDPSVFVGGGVAVEQSIILVLLLTSFCCYCTCIQNSSLFHIVCLVPLYWTNVQVYYSTYRVLMRDTKKGDSLLYFCWILTGVYSTKLHLHSSLAVRPVCTCTGTRLQDHTCRAIFHVTSSAYSTYPSLASGPF